MAPQAVIASLVAIVNLGRSVGLNTFDDLMKKQTYNDHKGIFQQHYVPLITDQDLISFMNTGIAKFKNDQGNWYTFDPNEVLAILADTPGMANRMLQLNANANKPAQTISALTLSSSTSNQSFLSKYWLWLLLGFAVFYLLTKKKRRKK